MTAEQKVLYMDKRYLKLKNARFRLQARDI